MCSNGLIRPLFQSSVTIRIQVANHTLASIQVKHQRKALEPEVSKAPNIHLILWRSSIVQVPQLHHIIAL